MLRIRILAALVSLAVPLGLRSATFTVTNPRNNFSKTYAPAHN